MFAIGDREWPGISKLVEECGEVLQVCGKLMGSRGKTTHWNVPDLKTGLEEEIADLQAACLFVTAFCKLDGEFIAGRTAKRLERFVAWHNVGDPEPEEVN